jgi:PBP1b-binding outer membrane lipoprotein LpoB
MKLKSIVAGSLLAGMFFTSCAENNTNKDVGDTIETPLTDTVNVPTQGYGPDMSTTQVPDTMPKKDSTK